MLTFNFKKWNNLLGWVAFLIALGTYVLTLEPTLSFWDAGEYISTSTKLQVGHPPGAPLYQMLGAFFSIFAPDNTYIAYMVNMVAAVSSAFTILFMFWSSTNILNKVVRLYQDTLSTNNQIAILGSSFVGALAFTFSDTFWYSAVEAEVYATAMFLIALLLWLGLRWVDDMDLPRGNKWLVLIGLVIGMSFGVHFMALLTIPSIGYLYYFKKYPKVTLKNFIIANVVIVAILFFVFMFLLPYTLAFFGKSEIFFVNSIGLPFNSGTILAFVILVAFFFFGLKYTRNNGKQALNTVLLTLLFIFIGFSCWLMLPIRANTQIPINENKPSDAAEILAYYNREQYGSRSLFYDTFFTSKYKNELDAAKPYVDGKPNYERDYQTGKYVVVNVYKDSEPNYSSKLKGFLPRMWSTDGSHPQQYMRYGGPLQLKVEAGADPQAAEIVNQLNYAIKNGDLSYKEYEQYLNYILNEPELEGQISLENPSFVQNMKFMFDYQFGYMYWRYLMWNFSGRQNDIQGTDNREHGNWVTGIKFLDEIRLGSQSDLPSDLLNNKGSNHYYMLPFIIGLIGFFWHYRRDPKSFYVLLALFLFTSIALKIFLNERPFEPRERDYAVVGSFMVFAMWVGFGVYAIYEALSKKVSVKTALPLTLAATFLAAPVLMAKENWDDHDRSEKYTALAMAKAYLDSVEPNGIIFTIGDNDTFPLWYLQEVEGYRTDVRVVCTALLQAEWYIDQMKVAAYESAPLKIRFDHKQYTGNNLYYAAIVPTLQERFDINAMMEYIASDDPRTKVQMTNGADIVKIPTNKIRIPVDKQKVLTNGTISSKFADQVVDYIDVDMEASALYRQRIIMLDIIANNNWDRPIYFTSGSLTDEDFLWMKDYLQLSGVAYKLVPVKTDMKLQAHPLYIGNIDTDKMYKTVSNWYWGNMGSDRIYHDPETRRNAFLYRINLTRLAEQLIAEGKNAKAKHVVDIAMTNLPIDYYESYMTVEPFAELYYELGEVNKANDIVLKLAQKYEEYLRFYASMKPQEQSDYAYEIIENIQSLQRLSEMSLEKAPNVSAKVSQKTKAYESTFKRYLDALRAQEKQDEMMAKEMQRQQDSVDALAPDTAIVP